MRRRRLALEKVGVVFSGGGLTALASATATFIVLDEMGIRPAAVCGSSGGALGAVLYASGLSGERMAVALSKLQLGDYYDPDLFGLIKAAFTGFKGWTGLLEGKAMQRYLKSIMPVYTFEECRIPCYLVAVNISTRRKEVLHRGDLVNAAIASAAIPFIFEAVERGGDLYLDGGAISNVPAFSLARMEPSLTHILVSSTQDLTPLSNNDKEDLTNKTFAPYHIFRSWIETVVDEERLVHLDTNKIPNTLMEVDPSGVDFHNPDGMADSIEQAVGFIRDFLGSAWS
jgi:predicted acylesterase/phospholipase RssA